MADYGHDPTGTQHFSFMPYLTLSGLPNANILPRNRRPLRRLQIRRLLPSSSQPKPAKPRMRQKDVDWLDAKAACLFILRSL